MLRQSFVLALALGVTSASAAFAEPAPPGKGAKSKKDAKKAAPAEEKKPDASAGPADAKSEKPATKPSSEEDVVLDNRDLASRRVKEQQKQEEEHPSFENDTPFANSAPDPVALREQRWKPGFGGGYRLGFAFPMGSASSAQKFSDAVDGMIFLWGEFGYWPDPHLFAGLFLGAGYVLPDCGGNASCSGWDLRGGPEVVVRVMPFQDVTPFLGVGAGYEWLTASASTEVLSSRQTVHGFELVHFQAGIDVRTRGDFYGMFLFYSLSKFTKESLKVEDETGGNNGFDRSGDIDDPKIHSWLGIGARGTLE